ncbi:MAG: peptidase M1 [Deltaproteobacteria bacterium]|nr:peptidase M1 [Deltaproteobacteria bacterium]
MLRSGLVSSCLVALAACSPSSGADEYDVTSPAPSLNWQRDVVATRLEVDLASDSAIATLDLAASTRTGASFEVGTLAIESVEGPSGPIPFRVDAGRLDVGLAARKPAEVRVRYSFERSKALEGVTLGGTTFTWPHFCGNVFPCKSQPADGQRFELAVTGAPSGRSVVYPSSIVADAPSYMLAWAVGDYTKLDLGETKDGRRVSVHYLPGEKSKAVRGTEHLVAAFEWLESTYGEYLYGDDVGSVSAAWGPGAFGGMEHHPLWHVASSAMDDEETHVHEAAHGWFGDAVRLSCWEDLTLSEGTVSYLAARALEAVAGASFGATVWQNYESRLDDVIATEDRVALPASCNEVDVLRDLWNEVPYMKGAFFYRAVETEVGRPKLDAALAAFYARYRGKAARMQDMLDTIADETGFDPAVLAEGWLRSLGRPDR